MSCSRFSGDCSRPPTTSVLHPKADSINRHIGYVLSITDHRRVTTALRIISKDTSCATEVAIAREKLKEAQSRQKSYADKPRRVLEFKVGDHVFLKVSPCRGVRRFGIEGKLSPRFIDLPQRKHPTHNTQLISHLSFSFSGDETHLRQGETITKPRPDTTTHQPPPLNTLSKTRSATRPEMSCSRFSGDCSRPPTTSVLHPKADSINRHIGYVLSITDHRRVTTALRIISKDTSCATEIPFFSSEVLVLGYDTLVQTHFTRSYALLLSRSILPVSNQKTLKSRFLPSRFYQSLSTLPISHIKTTVTQQGRTVAANSDGEGNKEDTLLSRCRHRSQGGTTGVKQVKSGVRFVGKVNLLPKLQLLESEDFDMAIAILLAKEGRRKHTISMLGQGLKTWAGKNIYGSGKRIWVCKNRGKVTVTKSGARINLVICGKIGPYQATKSNHAKVNAKASAWNCLWG
ncbi:hypothetical protein E3N88_25818 [Mikania micrantha]|uniref:Uncharacterized protein n=1 Tax=Mikania micrantha TaxID=192012 RepID=A0A5N6N5U2_9ASTR|nr:hypothetical protein E3N88_25818 [Mikania micrantha]